MEDAIAAALTNLREARRQTALAVAEAQTKLQNLDQMIARLEAPAGIDPELLPQRREYADLGTTEAARRYLTEVGRPLTTPELAAGLLERGLKSRAKRFVPSLYATLMNNANSVNPVFKRIGEGREATWALRPRPPLQPADLDASSGTVSD
jgi:hypothetical protein